ncbi:hypothetical protein AAC387_Pa07g2532 [Persea americana]
MLFEEEVQTRDEATKFFSNLLKPSPSHIDEALFEKAWPFVSTDQNELLIAIPSPQEIKEAIFQLKRNSSPGPDRFPGIFFTSCWQIVGPQVIAVEEILSLKMEELKQAGIMVPVSHVNCTPCHLLYADDILLFLKAHKRNLRRLFELLSSYRDSSGQCFNTQKSNLFLR